MKKILFICSLLMSSSFSYADTENSKIYLARAYEQIQSAQQLVMKAKADERTEQVETFNYDALESDLNNIGKGIQDYLNEIRISPNTVQVLRFNSYNQQQ